MTLAQIKISFLFLACLLSGCASVHNHDMKIIDMSSFQSIPIGSNSSDVRLKLGNPQRRLELKKSSQPSQELWVYNLFKDKGERVNIRFLTSRQQVVSKIFAPQESENESRLDFVLTQTFSGYKFAELSLPRCGDYVIPKVIYYNLEKGIFFYFHSLDRLVESIGYSSPQDLKENLEHIKKCKISKYESSEIK